MRNNYERITSRSRAGKRVTMIAAGARNEGGDGGAGCCALGAFTLAEMRAGFVVFEVVVVLIQLALNSQDFHPLLEASPDSPGVRLRLFRSGISYLSKVASNVLAEQLPRLFIPDVEHRLPRDQGVIYITRMKISRFIGDLSGAVNIVVPFNLTGQAEIQAQGLSVQLDSAIESTANGSARVSTISCHSTIRSVDVMNHNGGLFGLAVTVFKVLLNNRRKLTAKKFMLSHISGQGVSDNVRQLLQGLICKKVRKYLDGELNVKLAEVQTRTRLSEAIETNAVRSATISSSLGGFTIDRLLGKSISTDFYIDFRLREPPKCDSNTVDLACAGEVSYKGKGGTPFGPPAIAWRRLQSDKHMLMLQLSDYLPNSLLYHAHKQGLTRLHLTPSTPGVSQFLRTTCESSFCIADLIPQLTESYPNRDLELSIISTRAPAVLFSEKKGGVISVNLAGVVVIFVLEGLRRKQLVVLDAEVVADARLNLQQQNVSGSVELTKFELASRSATVKISREELSDTSILVSHLLQNMLNDLLTSGFPLPLPKETYKNGTLLCP
uniref:BPI2 domain-containing protein n=1 Tax=Angiostrongylus cantonensis TaxID=6313 RepID=A0A158P909_ANGCA